MYGADNEAQSPIHSLISSRLWWFSVPEPKTEHERRIGDRLARLT